MKNLPFYVVFALAGLSLGLHAQAPAAAPVALQDPPAASSPAAVPGTLLSARLKSFDSIVNAYDSVKTWAGANSSVQDLLDETWPHWRELDLKSLTADSLSLSAQEFDDYFSGAITLYIGDDFKWAKESKMLPVSVVMNARTATGAQEFIAKMKEDDAVIETASEAEGVERVRIDTQVDEPSDEVPADVNATGPQFIDLFIVTHDASVIVGNSLDYTLAALRAQRDAVTPPNAFWEREAASDIALWMDPRGFFAMVKDQLEAKAQEPNENGKSKIASQVFSSLGLNELEGLGLAVDFNALTVRCQLSYAGAPTGIARVFTCAPTGLEASPLIPADADQFALGRVDLSCLWTEVRRIAKLVMPASEVIYQGWQQQLQQSYGVDIDRQLLGALGTRYVYVKHEAEEEGNALYIALNDSVALQGALEGLANFVAQGKELFEREKIADVPVWRLKSEFQSANAPSIAYAITPQWLIVSIGDPTQMEDLIENARHTSADHPFFARASTQELLSHPELTSLGCRPLKVLLSSAVAAWSEVERRQAARSGDNAAPPPPAEQDDLPTFDDVTENVAMWSENRPGSVLSTFKIIPANE